MLDQFKQAAESTAILPGGVYFRTRNRPPYVHSSELVLLELSKAHPDVLADLASSHSSPNTVNTSALVGAFNTLCAIATAVRNRSYVIAAAVTSESGSLSASISSTLPSNAVLDSFVVMGALEVVEVTWEPTV